MVGTAGIGTPIYQGYSVSLSGDGNTLAVGGYGDNSFFGATWVFNGGVSNPCSQGNITKKTKKTKKTKQKTKNKKQKTFIFL